ncbi:DMT family transporter [Mucilaginibacter sp. PAMB04274]|uniref:EamA family transporter n=1 Tax=Mucilaginibacter sp. PAMB04274 TaxID=3138568 RepID=UPI0031F6D751
MTKYHLGVLCGAISFGILSSFVKVAYRDGFLPGELSFTQALIGAIVLWSVTWSSKKQFVSSKDKVMLLLSGSTIGISTYLYYVSVQYLSATIAIVLLMQFTWISMLIECFFFKKTINQLELFSALVIVAGTILASGLRMSKNMELPTKGILIVMLASIFYAVYVVANSKAGRDVNWRNKGAWLMSGSAIAIGITNHHELLFSSHPGAELLGWGLLMAIFGTILPPILFATSIPKVGASVSSLLMTIELPVAVTSAKIVLDEHISKMQIFGVFIMLAAIVAHNYLKFLGDYRTN